MRSLSTAIRTVNAPILMVVLLLWPHTSSSQVTHNEASIRSQQHFWTSVNATVRESNHWGWYADAHYRTALDLSEFDFQMYRLALGYWLNDQFWVSAGGGWQGYYADTESGRSSGNEWRVHQQLQWNQNTHRLRLIYRLRNEQRWREKLLPDGTGNGYAFSNRTRMMILGNFRIFADPDWPRLAFMDEVFVQFGPEIVYNTFDQNRVFVGIMQPIGRSGWSYDFGYMYVFQQRASGYEYFANHTLRLFFYYVPSWEPQRRDD